MKLEKGSTLVVTGDSITDCGRTRPQGESCFDGLGSGYPRFLDALIEVNAPGQNIRVINTGSGGDRTVELLDRWQEDVLDLHPDYISIMIGINDVWRHFDTPYKTELHVSPAEYEKNLRTLAESAKASAKKVFLLTPFFMETNKEDAMRKMTDEYIAVVKAVAADTGAVLVDVQQAFDELFTKIDYPARLGNDRVHPNHVGHMLIAKTLFEAL